MIGSRLHTTDLVRSTAPSPNHDAPHRPREVTPASRPSRDRRADASRHRSPHPRAAAPKPFRRSEAIPPFRRSKAVPPFPPFRCFEAVPLFRSRSAVPPPSQSHSAVPKRFRRSAVPLLRSRSAVPPPSQSHSAVSKRFRRSAVPLLRSRSAVAPKPAARRLLTISPCVPPSAPWGLFLDYLITCGQSLARASRPAAILAFLPPEKAFFSAAGPLVVNFAHDCPPSSSAPADLGGFTT